MIEGRGEREGGKRRRNGREGRERREGEEGEGREGWWKGRREGERQCHPSPA